MSLKLEIRRELSLVDFLDRILDKGVVINGDIKVKVGKFFFFQAEDGIRDTSVTGVQTCALPILPRPSREDSKWHGKKWPAWPCKHTTPARTGTTQLARAKAGKEPRSLAADCSVSASAAEDQRFTLGNGLPDSAQRSAPQPARQR